MEKDATIEHLTSQLESLNKLVETTEQVMLDNEAKVQQEVISFIHILTNNPQIILIDILFI